MDGVHTTEVVCRWDELLRVREDLGLKTDRWVYRGHQDANWTVQSTFERARESGGPSDPWKYEAAVVREFKQRAYHYLSHLPADRELLEWLALLRHFGAPSRLVDVTYSFYVAFYFAIKDLGKSSPPAAIWAFNTDWLIAEWDTLFPCETVARHRGGDFRFKDPEDFRKHFLDYRAPKAFVAAVNPFRQNQRLTAQQGLFLCPGDLSKSFMQNLFSSSKPADPCRVVRIPVAASLKRDAISELRRMNIISATLFPDLGGFAESLADWFVLELPFNEKDLLQALALPNMVLVDNKC